jgi:predicted transcriptional regulator with HTH domain
LFAETEYNSGAESEITLAVVIAVQELGVKVFRLSQADAEIVGDFPVHSTTHREIEIIACAQWRQAPAQ